jgi:ketosteroid isomerase-like protein
MRYAHFPIVALPLFLVAASACGPGQEPAETPAEEAAAGEAAAGEPVSDEAAAAAAEAETLRALEETVVAAFKAGEIDALAALYPEDVLVLAPNQPTLVGKDEVLAWLQGFFGQFTVDEFASPVEEVVVADAWAFSRGTFGWTLSPKAGGDPVRDGGKFIVIWRRAPDGSWMRARVIWNSDGPRS